MIAGNETSTKVQLIVMITSRIIVTTGKLWDCLQPVTSILSGPLHTPMRQNPIGDPKRSNKMNFLYFNGIIT